MPRSTGVYLITNLANGKVYVGSTVQTFYKRWKSHKNLLKAVKKRSTNQVWKSKVAANNRERALDPAERERLAKMGTRASKLSNMCGRTKTSQTLNAMRLNLKTRKRKQGLL